MVTNAATMHLDSLAGTEIRSVGPVRRHDAAARNLRNLSGFACALMVALVIALVMLGASAVQASGLV